MMNGDVVVVIVEGDEESSTTIEQNFASRSRTLSPAFSFSFNLKTKKTALR